MNAMLRTGAAMLMGTVAMLASGHDEFVRVAAAQDAAPSDADALVERGIALRRAGDDSAALPLFREAEQLEPNSTRVLVHLAAAYQALGQWAKADEYLTRALQDPSDSYINKHQAMLASARRTIDGHIAKLRVSGGPAGAEVRLNGKVLGKLPMRETTRVEAGIYTLEATLEGHYPITRSVALAGGELVQEAVELPPREARQRLAPRESEVVADSGPNWLAWTFGGLAAGAAVFSVFAYTQREQHAERWNDDDRCLSTTRTREQLCGNELQDGEQAERWMLVGGAATAVLTGAAIGSLWLYGSGDGASDSGKDSAVSCGMGIALVQCAGRF